MAAVARGRRGGREETKEAANRGDLYENRPIAKRASDDGPSRVDVANLKYRAIDRHLNLSVAESFQGADSETTGAALLVSKPLRAVLGCVLRELDPVRREPQPRLLVELAH
jgi:hypothetical protein